MFNQNNHYFGTEGVTHILSLSDYQMQDDMTTVRPALGPRKRREYVMWPRPDDLDRHRFHHI